MGGGKAKKKSESKYTHVHTANAAARESDDRRAARAASMEITRLERAVEKQAANMRGFVPENLRKRPKIDPLYDLKGAARPAREHYVDPNYVPEPEPENLMEQFKGNMWGHEEGRQLCQLKHDLGVALHNMGNQYKKAAGVLTGLLEDDPEDHVKARLSLLRCYFDSGDSANARAILDRFGDDVSVPFSFGRVLLECIALMLEEEDASEKLVMAAIEKANAANPYAIWVFAYYEIFDSAVEYLEEISDPKLGSVEEALMSALDDIELWESVEGALDALSAFIVDRSLPYPALPDTTSPAPAVTSSAPAKDQGSDEGDMPEGAHDMYVGMFKTALEMIEDERSQGGDNTN